MRFDSAEYRIWKKHQNYKALIKRTKKKQSKKRKRTSIHRSNAALKNDSHYNKANKRYIFNAPSNFSIVDNPLETLISFNSLLHHIRNNSSVHNEIYVDVSKVEKLTTDSLMYLLCILNNLNNSKKYHFSGNYPLDKRTRSRMFESGFNKYVDSMAPKDISRQTGNIQITSGKDINTKLAKNIVDFIKSKSVGDKKLNHIYEMMIELMGNTWKHAYNENVNELFDSCWYCYVEIENERAKITFLDTGVGIPKSIYKKSYEKMDVLGLIKDSEYIASALKGEQRTATQLSNRGKGLPSFVEIVNDGYIQKLRIVSLKGDVCVERNKILTTELNRKFFGTLYYWEINL